MNANYRMGTLDFENLHSKPDSFMEQFQVYANTKLANVYFTSELDKILKKESYHPQITTYSVHPGECLQLFMLNILCIYNQC